METLQALTQYYENYDEDNRLCSQRGSVEYLTTMRYIEKYLRPGMRILEIGRSNRKIQPLSCPAGLPGRCCGTVGA